MGSGREGERAAVEVGEFEVGAAGEGGFRDVGLGYLDAQVVVDGIAPGSRPVHRASEPPALVRPLVPVSPCPHAPSRPLVAFRQVLVQRSNGTA